jgi:hypothetical protein
MYRPRWSSRSPSWRGLDVGDHELRGRLVFRDLLGKTSFFQVAALAIDGLTLSREDADLLEQLGINTQLADVGIWPLTITRRTSIKGDEWHAMVAGLSALLNPNMAVRPVGAFMKILDRLEDGVCEGRSVVDQLTVAIQAKERIPGVGRPALGPDERNAQVVELATRFGRAEGPSWKLAWQVDEFFARTKGQHVNSAGLQGALMRDLGFSPQGATAMCVLYFIVPVLAHATFARNNPGQLPVR